MAKKRKTRRAAKRAVSDVGIIHSGTSGRHNPQIAAFKQGMALYSGSSARTPRYAKDRHGTLDSSAADLVRAGVTVLVAAGGSRSAIAAKNATTTIPIIVTSVSDPSRPAANVAGICARTTELDPVRLQLLLELLPGKNKIGALYNPSRFDVSNQRSKLESKAGLLGIREPLNYQPVDPNGNTQDQQIDDAFRYWTSNHYQAAIVTADPLFNNHIDRIVKTSGGALRKIPAIYQWREFAVAGGLMSYGPNLTLAYKLAGTFVGQIVSGAASIEKLPLLPLDSFELVINLRTAKELGITVPMTLLARATDVIV